MTLYSFEIGFLVGLAIGNAWIVAKMYAKLRTIYDKVMQIELFCISLDFHRKLKKMLDEKNKNGDL